MFFAAQGVLPDTNKVMVWQEFFIYGQNGPTVVSSSCIAPSLSFFCPGSDTYYGFLLLIREVLGAMVGFLGAVLGGWCFGCPKGGAWFHGWIFTCGFQLVRYWRSCEYHSWRQASMNCKSRLHMTDTKQSYCLSLFLMVTWKVWRRFWERSDKSMKENIDRHLFFVADNHIKHQKWKISQNVWPWPVTMPQMAPVSHCWSVTWKSFPSLNWNCFGAVRHHRHRHVLRW